jgi:AbrB family looped-hinge helix DNA binding protein
LTATQCILMMKKTIFYGSATVGERGQIALPVKLRKEFNINKGDKLLVIGNPHHANIMLVNPETMNRYLEIMSENINQIKSTMKKK